ncbi:MAG TPA: hypothetical protein VGL35_13415 [Rhizomicrobium sp.]|jgi:hypothetical protein
MAALPLTDWHDFYVMVGTASGALVGASFIVATLAGSLKEKSTTGLRGFISPTVVHLGSVLVASAILTAPALTPSALAILLGIGGIAGIGYGAVVARRVWTLRLDIADRACYLIVPILAYAAVTAAAVIVRWAVAPALDALAIALVVILIVGMRNTWDMATFILLRGSGT